MPRAAGILPLQQCAPVDLKVRPGPYGCRSCTATSGRRCVAFWWTGAGSTPVLVLAAHYGANLNVGTKSKQTNKQTKNITHCHSKRALRGLYDLKTKHIQMCKHNTTTTKQTQQTTTAAEAADTTTTSQQKKNKSGPILFLNRKQFSMQEPPQKFSFRFNSVFRRGCGRPLAL